jgi:uncharacterized protein with HEPN domain
MSDPHTTLLAILDAIDKIERYSKKFSNDDDFYHDELSFDATMMQFIVIGEMVVKISDMYKKDHPDIPWQEIKDFRNIVAHNYFGIDSAEIWSVIKTHLPKLKSQISSRATAK